MLVILTLASGLRKLSLDVLELSSPIGPKLICLQKEDILHIIQATYSSISRIVF